MCPLIHRVYYSNKLLPKGASMEQGNEPAIPDPFWVPFKAASSPCYEVWGRGGGKSKAFCGQIKLHTPLEVGGGGTVNNSVPSKKRTGKDSERGGGGARSPKRHQG